MRFLLDHAIDDEAVKAISHGVWTVDPDAKARVDQAAKLVHVDSWLFPEEFVVAFADAGFSATIKER